MAIEQEVTPIMFDIPDADRSLHEGAANPEGRAGRWNTDRYKDDRSPWPTWSTFSARVHGVYENGGKDAPEERFETRAHE